MEESGQNFLPTASPSWFARHPTRHGDPLARHFWSRTPPRHLARPHPSSRPSPPVEPSRHAVVEVASHPPSSPPGRHCLLPPSHRLSRCSAASTVEQVAAPSWPGRRGRTGRSSTGGGRHAGRRSLGARCQPLAGIYRRPRRLPAAAPRRAAGEGRRGGKQMGRGAGLPHGCRGHHHHGQRRRHRI